METAKAKSGRRRVTFDIDEENQNLLEAEARSREISVRRLVLSAFSYLVHPPMRFHSPRPPLREPLEPFLAEAREIAMVGITLSSLHEPSIREFMMSRIRDHVPMTFITVDPKIREQDPVHQLLNRRYGPVLEGGLKGQLVRTAAVFSSFRKVGLEAGVPIRVMGTQDLPLLGLAIADPLTPWCRIRVALYTQMFPGESYPLIDIDGRTREGMEACYAFLRHYEHVSQTARLIEESTVGDL